MAAARLEAERAITALQEEYTTKIVELEARLNAALEHKTLVPAGSQPAAPPRGGALHQGMMTVFRKLLPPGLCAREPNFVGGEPASPSSRGGNEGRRLTVSIGPKGTVAQSQVELGPEGTMAKSQVGLEPYSSTMSLIDHIAPKGVAHPASALASSGDLTDAD